MNNANKIAKDIVFAIIMILCAMFVLRCCFASDHSTLSKIYPTDGLKSAYAAAGQEMTLLSHPVAAEISENGYMTCYAFVYCPDANEVQLTVRYNASVFEYNDLPEGTVFTYTLTDSDTEQAVTAVVVETETKWMYTYHRIVFPGVTVTDTNNLVIRMYAGDTEIASDVVHYADQNVVLKAYKLSRSEKKALAGE